MYMTNHFETGFLNTMRGVALTAPSGLWISLLITNPGESGQGTEVTYTGYKRQPISFTVPAMDAGLSQIAIKNDAEITFPQAPDDAGTATYIGIYDSEVGGNMWLYGEPREPLVIEAGESPIILAQEIIFYSTGNLSQAYKTKLLNVMRGQSIQGYVPYLSLWNGSPDSGGAELTGANYARVSFELSAPSETESGQSMVSNTDAVNFNRPSTTWGTWSYGCVCDAASNGNAVWLWEKTPPKEIKKGYMPRVETGGLKMAVN